MFDWIYTIFWAFFSSYLIMRIYNGGWVLVRLIYLWYIRPRLDLTPYKNLWTGKYYDAISFRSEQSFLAVCVHFAKSE